MSYSRSRPSSKEKGSSILSVDEHKYRALKRKMRDVLDEHDHLTAKLKKAKYEITYLKQTTDILLDRLMTYEDASSSSGSDSDLSSSFDSDSDSMDTDASMSLARNNNHTHAQTNPRSIIETEQPEATPSIVTKSRARPASKRYVPVKLRKVQPVPRDESGKPIVPFKSGIITVHQLGEVVYDRKNFHSERYIYPVGYVSSRNYASMVSPTKSTRYVCSILDSGADGPRFQIVPDDAPQNIITAQSATGAWTAVLKGANAVRNRENSASASGPEYFGFSHPTVQSLIQELPGVERCANYVRQEYERAQMAGNGRGKEKAGGADQTGTPASLSPLTTTGNDTSKTVSPTSSTGTIPPQPQPSPTTHAKQHLALGPLPSETSSTPSSSPLPIASESSLLSDDDARSDSLPPGWSLEEGGEDAMLTALRRITGESLGGK